MDPSSNRSSGFNWSDLSRGVMNLFIGNREKLLALQVNKFLLDYFISSEAEKQVQVSTNDQQAENAGREMKT